MSETPIGAQQQTGYRAPTQAETTKLGVWLWLASDCALFASFIATYLTLHGKIGTGPGPKELFDLRLTAVATFVLLTSSLTMGMGLEAFQHGDNRGMRRWVIPTILLGMAFVGMQVFEFTHYEHLGLHLSGSDFGASFYTLVGFHGLHVSFGVAWLISLLIYSLRKPSIGPSESWRFEVAALYWYFVDVVWVVIFTVVYLLGKVG